MNRLPEKNKIVKIYLNDTEQTDRVPGIKLKTDTGILILRDDHLIPANLSAAASSVSFFLQKQKRRTLLSVPFL